MIQIRRAEDRGPTRIDWLDSKHSFSFGEYYDPQHMGFGPLRVINEDRVIPGAGFHPHGHRDMEIISYVLDGALEHKDSIGTGSVIRPGDVQRMSAGSGIRHSEFNHSDSEPVHFLQIWIVPEARNLEPGYEQKAFAEREKRGKLKMVQSRFIRMWRCMPACSTGVKANRLSWRRTAQPGSRWRAARSSSTSSRLKPVTARPLPTFNSLKLKAWTMPKSYCSIWAA